MRASSLAAIASNAARSDASSARERVFEAVEALCLKLAGGAQTRWGQVQRPRAAVGSGAALEQPVGLEPVGEADGPGVCEPHCAGETVDRRARQPGAQGDERGVMGAGGQPARDRQGAGADDVRVP